MNLHEISPIHPSTTWTVHDERWVLGLTDEYGPCAPWCPNTNANEGDYILDYSAHHECLNRNIRGAYAWYCECNVCYNVRYGYKTTHYFDELQRDQEDVENEIYVCLPCRRGEHVE